MATATGKRVELDVILPLLQRIDGGYEPSEAERRKLTEITKVDGWGVEIEVIPSSICQLTQLEALVLNDTNISNLDALAGLTNLRTLYLRNTKVEAIDVLAFLTQLETLNLNSTNVSNLDALARLTNLRFLYLQDTNVEVIDALASLTQLEALDLSYTSVSNLDALAGLTNLQVLYLRNTKVEAIDALASLTQLKTLNLNNTNISNLYALAGLTNLQVLYLRNTKMEAIDALASLTQLKTLNLNSTSISNLDALTGLNQLRVLGLWGTNVEAIDALASLTQLEILDLDNSKVISLPEWMGELPNLCRLNLSNLQLHSLPQTLMKLGLDFSLENSGGGEISLENTTLATQPISLFAQPRELIQAYFGTPKVPINEAKVIFLGDGGAGKTHTIKRILEDGKEGDYQTETTPGIDITPYQARRGDRQFHINFWDFGGQEIMHAMHRCFLTERTCYVVVISNRWDLNRQARYWLRNIDSFAKGAPVLLAVNLWDDVQNRDIDMSRLTGEYPNLVKEPIFYSAKFSKESEFNQLIDAIIREAGKLDSTAMDFPEGWAAIRQDLMNMAGTTHYIDKTRYHEICHTHGLDTPDIRTWLLEWFNDLGVCFSYHQEQNTELAEYKVLNPKWLTNAIYIIINKGPKYATRGRVKLQNIWDWLGEGNSKLLPGVKYKEHEPDYVLEVMRKFNLSYAVPDTGEEFIPALCDSETPKDLHPKSWTKRISYQYRYTYLPDSVVHQLMILCYKDLNTDKIWRKGLSMNAMGLTAVVDMGDDDATLKIDVYSNGRLESWELLHELRMKLAQINRNLGLSASESIVVRHKNGQIAKPVEEFLVFHANGVSSLPIYFEEIKDWGFFQVDDILNETLGADYKDALNDLARKKEIPLADAFRAMDLKAFLQKSQSGQIPEDFRFFVKKLCAACQFMQGDHNYWKKTEDDRNDYIRDHLRHDFLVHDQAHTGLAPGGKRAGELDMDIRKTSTQPWTVLEALNIKAGITDVWKNHLQKLLENYNPHIQNVLFLLSYVECPPEQFLDNMATHFSGIQAGPLPDYKVQNVADVDLEPLDVSGNGLKIIRAQYIKETHCTTVYHVYLQLGQ